MRTYESGLQHALLCAVSRRIDARLTIAALRAALGYLSPVDFEAQHAQQAA